MAFSLDSICFNILFTTRRSFQPAWQSQNCLCFETDLMKHITKVTKPHARMRLRGGVDHSLALTFFGIQLLDTWTVHGVFKRCARKRDRHVGSARCARTGGRKLSKFEIAKAAWAQPFMIRRGNFVNNAINRSFRFYNS